MKKLTSWSLILVFGFSLLLSPYYFIQVERHRTEVRIGKLSGKVELLEFSTTAFNKMREGRHEFRYNGIMWDIERMEYGAEKVRVWAHADHYETGIMKRLKGLFDSKQPEGTSPHTQSKSPFVYLCPEVVMVPSGFWEDGTPVIRTTGTYWQEPYLAQPLAPPWSSSV